MRLDNCEEKEYLSPMINGSLNTTGECDDVTRKENTKQSSVRLF